MKVTRLRLDKTPLPYDGGSYGCGARNAIETAIASVVVIDTDARLQGCGEFTTCGRYCMAAHFERVEALSRLVARRLLGEDPRHVVRIKQISSLGGRNKARRTRDHLVRRRIPVVSEDTWGGEIATAVLARFATPTPPEYLRNTTELMNYHTRSTSIGCAVARDGRLYAPEMPGLALMPDFEGLGAPVAEWRT